MADSEQLSVLNRGVTAWNMYRKLNPEVQPDLRWVNLSLANLRGVDLSQTRLDRANLSGAMLSQANLHGASLREASLGEANLSSARLDEANLKRADLSRANLSRASLKSATLTSANLSRTDFFETDLTQATLTEAFLYQTSFANTRLAGAIDLETCRHLGPSIIEHRTLAHHPHLPPTFLQGCGLQAWEIEAARLYDPALTPAQINDAIQQIHQARTQHPLQIHNLFLSYSYANTPFIEHLETDLNTRHIRYWRDEHDAPKGRLHNIVTRAMRPNPTVLLILSEHSVERNWVEYEIDQAHKLEQTLQRNVLCLINLDDSWTTADWSEELTDQVVQYPMLDFSTWQEAPVPEDIFPRLIAHLGLFGS